MQPRLGVDGDRKVHLAWSREVCVSESDCSVHNRYSTNRSGTWSASVNVGDGYNPQVAVSSDGKAHIVTDGPSRGQHTTNRSGALGSRPR